MAFLLDAFLFASNLYLLCCNVSTNATGRRAGGWRAGGAGLSWLEGDLLLGLLVCDQVTLAPLWASAPSSTK